VSLLPACGTLTVAEEKQLGHQVQRQIREQLTLMRDPVTVRYIRNLGAKLVAAADPSPFDFRFYVVEDADLNAFAVPGGAIYVHTGLIEAVDDVSELAGVLAHEAGHVTARHVAENYHRQRNTGVAANIFAMLAAILTGSNIGGQAGSMIGGVAGQAYLSTYTQDAEREADRLAIDTMIRAGIHPNGLVTMFRTLQAEKGGSGGLQFLSSHPATAERIANVNSGIAARAPLPTGLRRDDGGKLQIIQKRLELIVGTDAGERADE
jgi:predicted Zn-dependent protease